MEKDFIYVLNYYWAKYKVKDTLKKNESSFVLQFIDTRFLVYYTHELLYEVTEILIRIKLVWYRCE